MKYLVKAFNASIITYCRPPRYADRNAYYTFYISIYKYFIYKYNIFKCFIIHKKLPWASSYNQRQVIKRFQVRIHASATPYRSILYFSFLRSCNLCKANILLLLLLIILYLLCHYY